MTEESAKTLMTALAQFIDSEIEALTRLRKERKPAEVDESTKRLNDNWMKRHFDDYEERTSAEWAELQSEFKNINEAFEDGKKEVLAHPEKYGLCECVPAEWSDEDSDNLERVDNYLWMLDNYVGDDCATPQGKADKIRENIQKVLSPWIKSLPERFSLRSKQEWSEEDKKMMKAVDESLYCYESGKAPEVVAQIEAERRWFYSLPEWFNLQPKQEWSEEDKEMLRAVIYDLERHDKDAYAAEIKWLKCLDERFNLQPKEGQKYDGNMDKECIKLCDILNSIPSIDTFESCCGHLKDRYSVWFFCNDTVAISRLGRSVDRNYSDGKWELLVDSTDTHPTGVFWLRSKVPFQSYDEMEESVNELCVYIQYWFNTKFDSYFNGDSRK